jgi:hypothetical protein
MIDLENYAKCYTVAFGNIPLPPSKEIDNFLRFCSGLEGLVGVHPCYPKGTLLIFENRNHAKRARNRIEHYGVHCGNNIGEVFVETKYLRKTNREGDKT